ncbi:hypothetical protein IEQ34_002824 [Dendrobium chrysotoxum]|uniref:BTB/POZ domain-containing protein n=1 Tax=Dendrobium chrysotoxum TaxID=161865 RepID=A0AAV7HFK0_DENCH|nr:hypothetical protein IEQ34_002824 [Dendrobium chrysotoxum]
MRRCDELGLVETIYEADHEEDEEEEEEEDGNTLSNPASSFTISPVTLSSINLSSTPCSFPSSSPALQTIIDGWSKAVGHNCDIVIRVNGDCFFLHREPMISASRYLRRRLWKDDDVSVSPPLNITVETFAELVRFCYSGALRLTPLNLAAVTAAAALLEMEDGVSEWSIARRTEEFFRREIAGDEEKAEAVLWSCVEILPGAGESAAEMAARCVQVLTEAAADGEDGGEEWIAKLTEIPADSFRMIMESMARWSVYDHDHLYRIADRYFRVNNDRLSDEEKLIICHSIDCSKLSHHLLLHLVQNSLLPLRFIFKAMLLPYPTATAARIATLGDLLHHDAAAHQASNLAVRIESLERDVAGLRRRLRWSEEKRIELESGGRAQSFRFLHGDGENGAAAAPAGRRVGKGRGLGRKLVEGFRRFFRRDKEGERAGHMMMNKYLAFY